MTVDLHLEVRQVLRDAGLWCDFEPIHDAPRQADGRVAQFVSLAPAASTPTYGRATGLASGHTGSVQVRAVGPTVLDCLAVADKIRAALDGRRLANAGPGGGRLQQEGFTGVPPTVEPGTDPVRVSLPITYQVITKREHP